MKIGNSGQGRRGAIRAKNAKMASDMKKLGIERTQGVCAQCYAIITIDSRISTYKHVCRG